MDQIDITINKVCTRCRIKTPLRYVPELVTLSEHTTVEARIDPDEFLLCATCGNPLRLHIQAQPYELLAPGGSFYFTTQIQHPQLDFIANVLPNRDGKPWIMKCRPVSLLEEWMQSAGFVQVQSEVESVGLFAVTQGCKMA